MQLGECAKCECAISRRSFLYCFRCDKAYCRDCGKDEECPFCGDTLEHEPYYLNDTFSE